MSKDNKKIKILIIRLSALGDIVHSFHALKYLNEKLEESPLWDKFEIDFLIYKSFKDLLFDLAFINKIHILENKKLSTLLKMTRGLSKENYDYIIDFQGLIKTSLIGFLTKGKSIGFAKPREWLAGWLYKYKLKKYSIMQKGKHVVEHNLKLAHFALCQILKEEGVEAIPEFIQKKNTRIYKLNIVRKIVLIPCTTWESKFWDRKYWIELIEKLQLRFPSAKIYMTGVLKEKAYLEAIRYELPRDVYEQTELILDKSLIGLKQFFLDAELILGVDTGPLHLAADALYNSDNAHIIGIYGPTSASRSGPYSFHALSFDELFNKKASHKRTLKKDKGSINHISVEDVFDKVLSLTT
mgnify:CR=1 FL=1